MNLRQDRWILTSPMCKVGLNVNYQFNRVNFTFQWDVDDFITVGI